MVQPTGQVVSVSPDPPENRPTGKSTQSELSVVVTESQPGVVLMDPLNVEMPSGKAEHDGKLKPPPDDL